MYTDMLLYSLCETASEVDTYVRRKKEGRGREGEREGEKYRYKSWCVSETCLEGQTLSR